MLSVIRVELRKMLKNRVAVWGLVLTAVLMVLSIMKDLQFREMLVAEEWIRSTYLVFNIIILVLSGFVITIQVHAEYQNNTIINMLTVPIDRVKLIIGKLVALLIWYLMFIVVLTIEVGVGEKILFAANAQTIATIELFIGYGILEFVSYTPILLGAILQKRNYYVSILLTLFLLVMRVAGINASGAFAWFGVVNPWSAALIMSLFEKMSNIYMISLCSIIFTGIISIFFSCHVIRKQDQ